MRARAIGRPHVYPATRIPRASPRRGSSGGELGAPCPAPRCSRPAGAVCELGRPRAGVGEAVNVSGIDAAPGSVLRFRGRTTNRIPDGTYTWFTVSTNATGMEFEEKGATTHATTTR